VVNSDSAERSSAIPEILRQPWRISRHLLSRASALRLKGGQESARTPMALVRVIQAVEMCTKVTTHMTDNLKTQNVVIVAKMSALVGLWMCQADSLGKQVDHPGHVQSKLRPLKPKRERARPSRGEVWERQGRMQHTHAPIRATKLPFRKKGGVVY